MVERGRSGREHAVGTTERRLSAARAPTSRPVLDLDGKVIEGLHATGNVMAGLTGMTYGGGRGTLGPAVVFGYIAGRHAARS